MTMIAESRPENTLEQRLQLLIEAVTDYGIFMLDPGGHIVSWNSGAQKLKGYKREEILGKHFSIFYPPEAVASGCPKRNFDSRSCAAASRTKVGACARTARASGPT
jgi:PAS domain-containing protein